MSMLSPYQEALAALALEVGLDSEALVAREELCIDANTVVLAPTEHAGLPALRLACKVGSLPAAPSLSLLRLLLQANTLVAATGGTTLGLQHAGDALVLTSAHPLDTPAPALARACRLLAEMACAWAVALGEDPELPDVAASMS